MPKDTQSPLLKRLGARVKELREAQGLSQVALAKRTGISRVYISGVERGIRNLTFLQLAKIGRTLKANPSELIEHW